MARPCSAGAVVAVPVVAGEVAGGADVSVESGAVVAGLEVSVEGTGAARGRNERVERLEGRSRLVCEAHVRDVDVGVLGARVAVDDVEPGPVGCPR